VRSVSLLLSLLSCWSGTNSIPDERFAGIWDDFYVVDGRLVTGQNPASSTSTAKAAIEVFNKL
jgi:putative intracellular protease/amidase